MKEGWTYKKLGEVCEIFGRIGFRGYTKADLVDSPNDGAITLSPSNIVNGEMDYSKCSYITWAKYEESPEIMIYPGDILLVKTASVGKTALVRDLPHKATINPQFVVLKNIETNHEYLSYYMKSEKAQNFILSIAKGAAAQTVSQKNLAEMQVPVPTKAEQQRIVSRLDSAFAHIDERKANAEKQLSEARALFQKALTKAMEPKEGWEEKKLKEIAQVRIGPFGSLLHKRDYISRGIPLVNPIHMIEGKIVANNDYTISEEKAKDLSAYLLKANDVVFARRGEIGRCAIVTSNEDGFLCGTGSLFVRFKVKVDNAFMLMLFQSEVCKNYLLKSASGATMLNINAGIVEKMSLTIPPLSEQQRIVSRLDSLSAHVRELEEVLQKTIAECDALKQALLRQVFE